MDEGRVPVRALCRLWAPGRGPRLGGVFGDKVVDLTSREPDSCAALTSLLAAPAGTLDAILVAHASAAGDYSFRALDAPPSPDRPHLLAPIDTQDVWAAGVTYTRSRQARMEESEASADVYARVYDAERPELFFKALPRHVSGPNGTVAVRPDATWTVPEPELTLLLSPELAIAGYTIGDDLTARDIEGQNPLYLPQAKVYDGACALGPVIVPAGDVTPYDVDIKCEIRRDDATLFADQTNTAELHRRLDELVAYLGRCTSFPEGAYLMTGTSIVPPNDVALRSGDEVIISISCIGTLRNTVR